MLDHKTRILLLEALSPPLQLLLIESVSFPSSAVFSSFRKSNWLRAPARLVSSGILGIELDLGFCSGYLRDLEGFTKFKC